MDVEVELELDVFDDEVIDDDFVDEVVDVVELVVKRQVQAEDTLDAG